MSKNVIGFAGSLLKMCVNILPNFLIKPLIYRASNATKSEILMESVKRGNKRIFEFLNNDFANSGLVNEKSENLLHLAVKYGRTDIAKNLILNRKEMINAKDAQGETPLFHAVRQVNKEIYNELLNNNADIQVINNNKKDVLDYIYEAFGKITTDERKKRLDKPGDNYVKKEEEIGRDLIKRWVKQQEIKDVKSDHFHRVFDRILLNSHPAELKDFLKTVLKSDGNYIKNREEKGANFIIDIVKSDQNIKQILEKIKILAENGAGTELATSPISRYNGFSPLHIAYLEGKTQCVNAILKLGADIDIQDGSGRTILHYASTLPNDTENRQYTREELTERVEEILILGANPNVKDFKKKTARVYMKESKRGDETKNYDGEERFILENLDYLNELLNFWGSVDENPLNPNKVVNEQGQTSFHLVVQSGNTQNIEDYLKIDKLNPNMKDEKGMTPLCYAVINGNAEMVKKLYEYQVKINRERKIDKKIDILNQPDKQGKCLLHYAARNGNIEVLNFLLEKKPNANAVDNEGKTPIFVAMENNHLEFADLLERNISGINVPNKENIIRLNEAERTKNQILKNAGVADLASPNSPKRQNSSLIPANLIPNQTPVPDLGKNKSKIKIGLNSK